MATSVCNILPLPFSNCSPIIEATKPNYVQLFGRLFQKPVNFGICRSQFQEVVSLDEERVKKEEEKPRFKWIEIRDNITEEQKNAISELPLKMANRCKALMKQIICSSYQFQNATLSDLLRAWVRIMKPKRTDWLSVLKQLKKMEHPLYLQVTEFALLEESFEANVRDYTNLIHSYGKQNQLHHAENTLLAMKKRGFVLDQVTLTTMIHIYSKAGNLNQAKETFEELKLLCHPLDRRAYDSMIMAYIRARMPGKGEILLEEMDALELRPGTEVYKALLRAYSMGGDADGAQRMFDSIQFARIPPDVRMCGLLINAYFLAGQSHKALLAYQNMRKSGIEPNDKCTALVLAVYEKENDLDRALNFLMGLEREGILIGKESSVFLAGWFRKLGVIKEVELVLREHLAEKISW